MARLLNTVDDLVAQVRSMIDEDNVESIDTELDILPALNRAQDYGANILSRHYEEPLLTYYSLPLVSGQSEYDIPEDAFEDRVERIEIEIQGTYREVRRISYRDISTYETSNSSSVPNYYCIHGRKIRFIPSTTGTYSARVWYLRSPEELTLSQGRILSINAGSNYVMVSDLGAGISNFVDNNEAYINLIDGQTGEIKGTVQVDCIEGSQVRFKASPVGPVLNRELVGLSAVTDLQNGDYLANVVGTSVPYYGRPLGNFLIQYAVAELQRKLGGPADMELRVLEELEKQVERSWVGREQSLRVKKRSQNWEVPSRRRHYPRSN